MYWQQLANRILFGIDDYEVFSDISSKVWNTGRVLFHFPVKGRHKKGYTLDIHRLGFAAEQLAKWIGETNSVHPWQWSDC